MKQVTLEELLEAGCHFGHQVTRQNPRARDFIFEARDHIHIIDLEKTKEGLEEASEFVKNLAARNGSTMVVLGAKRQAGLIVKEHVKRAKKEGANGLFYVTNRWIGGIFTNFSEITKNFKRLKDLTERLQSSEERARYTKKEVSLWEKEKQKLESFYGGIADMTRVPDAIFIIDTHLEELAVNEAIAMGITTVGITDTNADPSVIDYPIPANDDAVGSIELITAYIVDAWVEGKKKLAKGVKEEKPVSVESTEKSKEAQKEEKPVKLAKEKKKATEKTPEKISVE